MKTWGQQEHFFQEKQNTVCYTTITSIWAYPIILLLCLNFFKVSHATFRQAMTYCDTVVWSDGGHTICRIWRRNYIVHCFICNKYSCYLPLLENFLCGLHTLLTILWLPEWLMHKKSSECPVYNWVMQIMAPMVVSINFEICVKTVGCLIRWQVSFSFLSSPIRRYFCAIPL